MLNARKRVVREHKNPSLTVRSHKQTKSIQRLVVDRSNPAAYTTRSPIMPSTIYDSYVNTGWQKTKAAKREDLSARTMVRKDEPSRTMGPLPKPVSVKA